MKKYVTIMLVAATLITGIFASMTKEQMQDEVRASYHDCMRGASWAGAVYCTVKYAAEMAGIEAGYDY